jgi:uncharacterized protein (TIGR01777 family)
MHVLVTGGTGLVGRSLRKALAAAGHSVTVVSREPMRVPGRAVGWDDLDAIMPEVDAVVNLAGASIADGRWTAKRKAAIRRSRVQGTRALVLAMERSARKPQVFVSASAVGFYGPHDDEELDETAANGEGFLASVCRAWEREASAAETAGVRVVLLRLGVVLAPQGGALGRMLIPFRACVGGVLGSGRQWMSWVHVDDVVGLVLMALQTEELVGPVNATAPNPVTNRDFTKALGRVLERPAVLPVPGMALRLVLGEMASMLLTGQRVVPTAAAEAGYEFRHPEIAGALAACVER